MEEEFLWKELLVSGRSNAGPAGPPAPPLQCGGPCAFSHLDLHLLKILVGRIFITVILHLVQVALLGGEHGVDLQEQRLWVTAGHPGDGTGSKGLGPPPAQRLVSTG